MTSSIGDGETVQRLPWFRLNNPSVQIILASVCLAFNPGFYLAVALLGAGGGQPSSADMANIANATLYGVFAVTAIGVPSLIDLVGPRITLLFACTGYPIFNGAMWYFSNTGHLWFPVFAGAYLGLAAACLWTTAVYMCNGYAEENSKAFWRGVQWIANMLGAAIGGSVALGITWNSLATSVPDSVYITFIVLQCLSMLFALLVQDPIKLRRTDGTAIAHFERISLVQSIQATGSLLKEWRTLLLFPCMFAPELFFPFQSTINAYAFNLRTRTLNSLLNVLFQFPITAVHVWLLDTSFASRKKRIFAGITLNAVWVTGAYIAQTIWLEAWDFDLSIPGPAIDCTDAAYRGAVVVYLFYAAQYGMFQSLVLYVLGSFTNDPRKSAGYGGLYIGLISSGTAISFGLNASGVPFKNINAGFFALVTLCWPILYFVNYSTGTDTNYDKEDGVIVPIHVRQELGLGKESNLKELSQQDEKEAKV